MKKIGRAVICAMFALLLSGCAGTAWHQAADAGDTIRGDFRYFADWDGVPHATRLSLKDAAGGNVGDCYDFALEASAAYNARLHAAYRADNGIPIRQGILPDGRAHVLIWQLSPGVNHAAACVGGWCTDYHRAIPYKPPERAYTLARWHERVALGLVSEPKTPRRLTKAKRLLR